MLLVVGDGDEHEAAYIFTSLFFLISPLYLQCQ